MSASREVEVIGRLFVKTLKTCIASEMLYPLLPVF
jgi:hypothetical protein